MERWILQSFRIVLVSTLLSGCALDASIFRLASGTDGVAPTSPGDPVVADSEKISLGSNIQALALGDEHTCALLMNSTVKCWGDNSDGQLGYEDTTERGSSIDSMESLAEVFLGVGRTAKAITAGYRHTCVILDNDQVKCWGYNGSGQLGTDDTVNRGNNSGDMVALSYVNLGAGRTAKKISAGGYGSTCAILDNDQLKCWGENSAGQLGYDSATNIGNTVGSMATLGFVDLGAGRTAKHISVGGEHTCAILDNDHVKCWGYGPFGQLGYDNTSYQGRTAGSMAALGYVNLGAGRTAKQISAGGYHTCAILDSDEVKCWGYNVDGQLGRDDTVSMGDDSGEMAALAVVDLGGEVPEVLSSNSSQSCVVFASGKAKCWGHNSSGQLGYDMRTNIGDTAGSMASLAFINAGTLRTFQDIVAGQGHTCAVLDGDEVKCWGNNGKGQLGSNDKIYRAAAEFGASDAVIVDLGAGKTAVDISLGSDFTCVILNDGLVKCWGGNMYGQLGYGDSIARGDAVGSMASLVAVDLGAGRTAKSISAGSSFICAILDNDQIKCWGGNAYGQLGYDDVVNRGDVAGSMSSLNYVNLGAGRTVKQIASGDYHSCAILDDDQVKCWGVNWDGQLGYDDTVDRGGNAGDMAALGYVYLGTGRTAKRIAVGAQFSCAILDNDQVKCWGANSHGNLGYDDTVSRGGNSGDMAALGYVDLGAGRTAKQISTMQGHVCVILDNDLVKCWGNNWQGQLGTGDLVKRGNGSGSMAALGGIDLGSGQTATQVIAGGNHTCIINSLFQVKCWGDGLYGQLGTDTSSDILTPATQDVINLGSGILVQKLDLGSYHSCAVLSDGGVKCWGQGWSGQLGYDMTENVGPYGRSIGACKIIGE